MHNRVEGTLNRLRDEYSVRKGRQGITKVLKHCITCKYLDTKPVLSTKTADLPNYRVDCNHVFKIVRIYIFCPIYCKDNYSASKEVSKSYILLFTRAVTSAVHLELTTDVSAESLIFA